jgi:hypothetical protein
MPYHSFEVCRTTTRVPPGIPCEEEACASLTCEQTMMLYHCLLNLQSQDIAMPNTALPYQTITDLAAQLKSRQLSPVEVTQALLQRITRTMGICRVMPRS